MGRGLWHPELQIGMKILEDRAPLLPAEVANLLTVVTEGERVGWVGTSLKVIGIEDVITEQVTSWRSHRMPSRQTITRIHVLIALAHRGIGGTFRAGYLQRRLAHDTGGEVAFEATWSGEGREHDMVPRTMAFSDMEAVANAWRVTSGFVFDKAPQHVSGHRERSDRIIRDRNGETGRGGGPGIVPTRIIPFDGMWPCDPENSNLRVTDDVAAYSA
jgi:hypothetical protein